MILIEILGTCVYYDISSQTCCTVLSKKSGEAFLSIKMSLMTAVSLKCFVLLR